MLTELEKTAYRFGFGDTEIALRFTLGAFLELEKNGLKYTDIFTEKVSGKTILEFFRAGLVEPIDDLRLLKIVDIIGFEKALEHCIQAVLQSFPKREENIVQKANPNGGEEFSFVRLRTLICDIMGKPESFFWDSTLGELIERWTEYARAMGYADEPEKILRYDDD